MRLEERLRIEERLLRRASLTIPPPKVLLEKTGPNLILDAARCASGVSSCGFNGGDVYVSG